MNSSFLLLTLPQDVVLHIFNDWLSSFKDFISFDKALTHKASRDLFFGLINSYPTSSNGSIQFDHTVVIKINNMYKFESMCYWEKKRGIYLRNVWIPNNFGMEDHCFLVKFGCLTSVTTLKLAGGWRNSFAFNLSFFLGNHLPCMESLTLESCNNLIVNPQVLNENSNVVAPPTKIKQLVLHSVAMISIDLTGNDIESNYREWSGSGRFTAIPMSQCWKVFLKIAQYCPKLQDLTIISCCGAYDSNMIPMIRSLPELTNFSFESHARNILAVNNDESVIAVRDPLPPPSKLVSLSYMNILATNLKEELDVMYACCDAQYLRHVQIAITPAASQARRQTLFHFIEQHWINLQSLVMYNNAISFLLICLRVCQQLQELQLLHTLNETIDETTFAALTVPNTLPHLRSLSFESCKLTNEAIIILCSSTVAQQLTSLKIWHCHEFHFHSLQLVARSFPHLEHFYLQYYHSLIQEEEIEQELYCRNVVKLLDVLFGKECTFANTIQTLQVKELNSFDFSKPEHQALAEELYNDHMVPHWTFPFPQLRNFSFEWKAKHHMMSQLVKQRVLRGHHPYLHSIKLVTQKVALGKENDYNLEVDNRSEVIRQLREKIQGA